MPIFNGSLNRNGNQLNEVPSTKNGPTVGVAVASIILCKIIEWVKGPLIIHSFEDRIENSFTTASSGKGTHGTDPSTHFDKEPFDDIGRAYAFPVLLLAIKEG